jgi:hypothetical protein
MNEYYLKVALGAEPSIFGGVFLYDFVANSRSTKTPSA